MIILISTPADVLKSTQLGLFDMPVQVAGSTDKNGVTRAPHMSIRKKHLPTHPKKVASKLDSFIEKHGGIDHLKSTLGMMTEDQRHKLVDAMAHIDGVSHDSIMERFGIAGPNIAQKIVDTTPKDSIVEHVTGRGRTLRGVIRKDISAEDAKAIDEYTFRKDGGWFIREKHLELAAKLDAAHAAGAISSEQHAVARVAGAENGPEGAILALRPAEVVPTSSVESVNVPQSNDEEIPREGDTKVEDGVEYVLHGGRWHRSHEDVAIEDEIIGMAPTQSPDIELAEDRQDLAESMMSDPHSDRTKELIRRVAAAESGAELDEDNPNSPNYRFKDTGFISGSRKALAALQIRQAARSGQRLRMTDIDWDELEENPREAVSLITKSNLFGDVDWDKLREGGMEPSAGFLIDRVYAAIGAEPDGETPQKRKDYALGMETLRDRMERCKTTQEVSDILDDIKDEISGEMLDAAESVEYKAIMNKYHDARKVARAAAAESDAVYAVWNDAKNEFTRVQYEREKRANRKWKPDPELEERYIELNKKNDESNAAYTQYRNDHPELKTHRRDITASSYTYENDLEYAASEIRQQADAILRSARARNIMSNPLTRAWVTLGDRFLSVVYWRSKSDAFARHVTSAKNGKITDWSWADKETTRKPNTSTKKQVHFQLKVAENFDRVGGRPVKIDSTIALKDKFNLRDVQSGNWVLNDINSAAFHVQKSAEAFSDLADILGVPDNQVSMNGRLAMAFGARGSGNAGFRGAARAHWEPVARVINLTKMGGGGALAHQWFHALDNMIREAEGMGAATSSDYVTENVDLVPPGELRDAVIALKAAITTGEHRRGEEIKYTDRELRNARFNVDSTSNNIGKVVKGSKDASDAVRAVDSYFERAYGPPDEMKRKIKGTYQTWRRLAAAYHDGNPAGGTVKVLSGHPMSSYQYEAIGLDEGANGKYWSAHHEMAARAFQSYVEDKLDSMGRKNDYLSAYADNKYYVDPIFGPTYPYPAADERTRINAAFDNLVGILGKRETLAKAFEIFKKEVD